MRQEFHRLQGTQAAAHVQQQYFPYDQPCPAVDVTAQADVTAEFEPGPDVRSEIYL